MRYFNAVIGIVILALAVTGIWLWETKGRERLLTKPVLVAAADIEEGSTVSEASFEVRNFDEDTVISAALSAGDVARLVDKEARMDIAAGQQVTLSQFKNPGRDLPKGVAIFVLKSAWIDGRSSSVRRGDVLSVYRSDDYTYLGSYEVAFAKDASEKEVENTEALSKNAQGEILLRTASTAVLDHVEIICTIEEYGKIREAVTGEDGETRTLLLVQEGL